MTHAHGGIEGGKKMDDKRKQEVITGAIETENMEIVKAEPMIGIVVGCKNLNVRKTPSPDAEIVQIIECGSEVMIDAGKCTDDFHAVCTASGAEGYCMKKFIEAE